MADSKVFDPFRAFKFVVTINGGGRNVGASLGFQKVTGLKEASDVVEYREGNMPIHKRKLPGLTNYDPITLSRGATHNDEILTWRAQVARWGGKGGFQTGAGDSGFFDGNPEADRQNRSLESAGASTANCSACSVIAALTTSRRLPRRLSLAARRRWAIWVAWPKALLALRLMG